MNCCSSEACMQTCGCNSCKPRTLIPPQSPNPKTASLRNCSHRHPQGTKANECFFLFVFNVCFKLKSALLYRAVGRFYTERTLSKMLFIFRIFKYNVRSPKSLNRGDIKKSLNASFKKTFIFSPKSNYSDYTSVFFL